MKIKEWDNLTGKCGMNTEGETKENKTKKQCIHTKGKKAKRKKRISKFNKDVLKSFKKPTPKTPIVIRSVNRVSKC